MLNKKNFLIIILLSLILIIFTFIWYKKNETKAFQEAKHIAFIKSKLEYINYLKTIFKIPIIKSNLCKKEDKGNYILYNCKNLSKNSFKEIENTFLNKLVDIKSFHLESNGKKVNVIMEIYKK